MNPTLKDHTGQRFGRLTVLSRANRPGRPRWLCICDCGRHHVTLGETLRQGRIRSCGCLRNELGRRQLERLRSR